MIQYLDRTVRLMRDEVHEGVHDSVLLKALAETRVVLVADEAVLRRHSACVALATTAQLAARSGAQVFLDVPNVRLSSGLPPLREPRLVDALLELADDLLPDTRIMTGASKSGDDVVILFGDVGWRADSGIIYRLNADDTEGRITRSRRAEPWCGGDFPLGGLAAAGLAAAEVFKASMRMLRPFARNEPMFDELLSPVLSARLPLLCGRPTAALDVREFDVVSGGAISHALLYCLAQVPGIRGRGRVIEPERNDAGNMNRYMLLRRSRLQRPKAEDLAMLDLGGLQLVPVTLRLEDESLPRLLPFAERVLVGVDDIPSRWLVQAQRPTWLGLGATSHFCAMSSWHAPGAGCAWCLHPRDEAQVGPIPTVAFVSFLAGLSLAARFIQAAKGEPGVTATQQEWLAGLRLDAGAWRTAVAQRTDCALRCSPPITRAA